MKQTGKIRKFFGKIISGVLAAATAATMVTGLSSVTAEAATQLNPQLLVNAAKSAAAAGNYNGSGYSGKCLAFVADIAANTYGVTRSSSCCAYKYGTNYIDQWTTSWANVPAGADIFFAGSKTTCNTCGNKCGHVGIYVGNGEIVHAWSGKIQKTTVQSVISSGYPMRGWGWHGNYNFSIDTTYKTFKNVKSGKMLNVVGNSSASGTNVTIYQADGTTGQKFKMNNHGTQWFGGVQYNKVVIEAQCAPACGLNVYGSYSAAGFNVNLWTKSGNNTQDWILQPAPGYVSGYYIIRSANNTNCVLSANGTGNGANVQLATYSSGNTSQIWYMG